MAGTRSSARNNKSPSPAQSDDALAGSKRKPETEASPKRDSKAAKKQSTIEETLRAKEDDAEMKDASDHSQDEKSSESSDEKVDSNSNGRDTDAKEEHTNGNSKDKAGVKTAKSTETKANVIDDEEDAPERSSGQKGGAIEKSPQREAQVPSNILEKGVIYFFTRNRVGIEDSESVGDLQRTFFVLRPMPTGAKLGDGALADSEHNRLLALPKKVFPKSHTDRFMAFVEKANTTIKDLKDNFFAANEYETKTQGTRRTEPVNPVAEGVYAITRTEDRTTHLVYSTTIPSEIGEVQEDLGIQSQGSFIISVKNPERSGPASAQLPQKPDFPKEYVIFLY